MAHDHPPDPKTYYVEQMCMIGICGSLGGVAVMLYVRNLYYFLVPNFQIAALVGGIGLLIVVWRARARKRINSALARALQQQQQHGEHMSRAMSRARAAYQRNALAARARARARALREKRRQHIATAATQHTSRMLALA